MSAKIQAKDVQTGMTIRWGAVTITVEEIVPYTQKNGIEGKKFIGMAKRSIERGNHIRRNSRALAAHKTDIHVKNLTWVTVK